MNRCHIISWWSGGTCYLKLQHTLLFLHLYSFRYLMVLCNISLFFVHNCKLMWLTVVNLYQIEISVLRPSSILSEPYCIFNKLNKKLVMLRSIQIKVSDSILALIGTSCVQPKTYILEPKMADDYLKKKSFFLSISRENMLPSNI